MSDGKPNDYAICPWHEAPSNMCPAPDQDPTGYAALEDHMTWTLIELQRMGLVEEVPGKPGNWRLTEKIAPSQPAEPSDAPANLWPEGVRQLATDDAIERIVIGDHSGEGQSNVPTDAIVVAMLRLGYCVVGLQVDGQTLELQATKKMLATPTDVYKADIERELHT